MIPSAEERARLAREKLGIGAESPVPDLLRLVEDQDSLRVFVLPLAERTTDSRAIDGVFKRSDGTPFVLLNIDHHPVRIRFTLAHEYGHYVLGHDSQVDVKISFADGQPVEVEANCFAAELLIPRAGVLAWLDRHQVGTVDLESLVRIAYYFNVSVPAALFRLVNMGKLKRSSKVVGQVEEQVHLELAPKLGLTRARDSIEAARAQGSYVPAEMRARVARLLHKGIITKKAAAARLRLPTDDDSAVDDALADLSLSSTQNLE